MLEIDTIDFIVDIEPCDATGAHADIEVKEEKMGIDYEKSVDAGEEEHIPIPGLSIALPVVGNAGVQAVVELSGDLDEFTVNLGLDACISVPIIGDKCGDALMPGELPIWVLQGKFDFSNLCENKVQVAKPKPKVIAPFLRHALDDCSSAAAKACTMTCCQCVPCIKDPTDPRCAACAACEPCAQYADCCTMEDAPKPVVLLLKPKVIAPFLRGVLDDCSSAAAKACTMTCCQCVPCIKDPTDPRCAACAACEPCAEYADCCTMEDAPKPVVLLKPKVIAPFLRHFFDDCSSAAAKACTMTCCQCVPCIKDPTDPRCAACAACEPCAQYADCCTMEDAPVPAEVATMLIGKEPASCIKKAKALCGKCGTKKSCWVACAKKNAGALVKAGCKKKERVVAPFLRGVLDDCSSAAAKACTMTCCQCVPCIKDPTDPRCAACAACEPCAQYADCCS